MRTRARSIVVSLCTLALALCGESPAFGGTAYHLSPSGDDAADGLTVRSAWKSFPRAQGVLLAGDTLLVHGGTYTGVSFFPANSGAAGQPITVRSAPGETAILSGDPTWGCIFILARDWYVIDGLQFVNINNAAVVVDVNQAKQVTLRNLVFGSNTGDTHVRVIGADSIVIENSRFDTTGSTAGGGSGDNIYVLGSSHVLIRGNQLSRAGHAAIDIIDYNGVYSAYNVIRDNVVEQHWGGGIYVTRGSHHTLVERNRISFIGEEVAYPKAAVQVAASDNIVRRNVITRTSHGQMADNGIALYAYTFSNILQNARRNYIYNNVVYKAGGSALYIWIGDDGLVEENKIVNNIFYANHIAGPTAVNLPAGNYEVGVELYHANSKWRSFPSSNQMYNNLILHTDSNGDLPGIPTVFYDYGNWTKTLRDVEALVPRSVHDNVEANPGFVRAEGDDYTLSRSSAAIDRGAHLAVTIAAGRSAVVPVNDAGFFSDGYGAGVGDTVVVGRNQPATVVGVSRAAGTVMLDREVSFNAGDFVDLPYGGDGPDLGAFESAFTRVGGTVGSPSSSVVRVNVGGGALTDAGGQVWAADPNTANYYYYDSGQAIGNTTMPALYQTQRWNTGPMQYSYSVANGSYVVKLKFAELYYPAAGYRKFDIVVNGQTVSAGFDVARAAGGWQRAVDQSFPVTVGNGQITVQLVPVLAGPILNGLEITASGTTTTGSGAVLVNAGGPVYTASNGDVWSADSGFLPSNTYYVATPIANTAMPVLYQTVRWNVGVLQWDGAVGNGTRTVTLRFSEIYHPAAGYRVFNIVINGQTVATNFDIAAAAGGVNRAIDKRYTVNVTGGRVTIQLVPVKDNPMINAIEIR